MRVDANKFLSKALGEDFFEALTKTELYKPNANIAIDIEDIRIGLKVVPRVIMSLLIRELVPMKISENKKVPLFLGKDAILHVTKHDTDTYSGQIVDDGKIVVNYKFRPLPGVGLVIMSAFELYEVEELKKEPSPNFIPEAELNIQKLIDERMALHHLVHSVVEQKMAHKEAIHQLFLAKITEELATAKKQLEQERKESEKFKSDISNIATILREDPHTHKDEYQRGLHNGVAIFDKEDKQPNFIDTVNKSVKKESPLKSFLAKKESKKPKNEFEFKLVKGETIECPDCKKNIFDGKLYSGCICLGDDSERKVFIKKSDDKYSIRFSKGWDAENIEMLLDVLRKKNG